MFMPTAGTLLDCCATYVRRRAGTPAARYRLALSSGFIVASVGMATVAIGQAGQAEDFFSAFGSLFSAPQAAAPQQQAYFGGSVRQVRRSPHRASYAGADVSRSRSHRHHVEGGSRDGEGDAGPIRLGRASMCVRLCDGFAFPVGDFRGEGDVAAHEATCRSECPGAQTALYVLPNGFSSIDEAFEARTGRAYSQKAAGFHYTTYLDESCTCHPKAGNRVASLLRDFTLRRGDAVVTSGGVKVFHGGAHFPFRQADFVRLAQSRDVAKASQTAFRAIERASVVSDKSAVAQAAKPTPPEASLKSLQHQAVLEPAAR